MNVQFCYVGVNASRTSFTWLYTHSIILKNTASHDRKVKKILNDILKLTK